MALSATASQGLELIGHVATGEILRIRGRIKERKKRRILTEASVETIGGESRAVASGIFLSLD